jgi:uncharacterized protein YbaP (TraB family)
MRKYCIQLFLLISPFIFSQEIIDKSLLWEISGKNLSQPSYLFGTMHIMCDGDAFLDDKLTNSLETSDKILMELNMDDPNLFMNMLAATMAKDGKSLTSKLGDKLAPKLDSLMQAKMGIPLAMMDNLSPQAMGMQVGILALKCKMGVGYDMIISEEAKRRGVEIIGLESLEDQIKALQSQTDEEAIQAIEYMITHFEETQNELDNMLKLYKNEDLVGLFEIVSNSYKDPKYPQAKIEDLLDKRNKNWIPIIKDELKTSSIFIAVGAAHLPGEMGVINLLRKEGYTVKPIK